MLALLLVKRKLCIDPNHRMLQGAQIGHLDIVSPIWNLTSRIKLHGKSPTQKDFQASAIGAPTHVVVHEKRKNK